MARLLIVDDDLSVRTFTARALADAGHSVEMAEDGADALDKIRQAAGAFDLVLSDIRMPAMDGIEMARTASKTFPGLRLLLMTGFADQRERAAELDGTVLGVVHKPFTLAEIRDRVGKALAA
ncbi:response regulator [Chelativorans sp.]|uniref:response regulator n=1 Tax=Chelativorans sp. TaxID=2203393 RepID=UPI0028126690|nr:response regulator [Chelativorans sp.]